MFRVPETARPFCAESCRLVPREKARGIISAAQPPRLVSTAQDPLGHLSEGDLGWGLDIDREATESPRRPVHQNVPVAPCCLISLRRSGLRQSGSSSAAKCSRFHASTAALSWSMLAG